MKDKDYKFFMDEIKLLRGQVRSLSLGLKNCSTCGKIPIEESSGGLFLDNLFSIKCVCGKGVSTGLEKNDNQYTYYLRGLIKQWNDLNATNDDF